MKTTPIEIQKKEGTIRPLNILATILEVVSYATYFPVDLILSPTRKTEIKTARQMYCYFAKKHTKLSLAVIGGFIGKDHSTVSHAIKAINNIIDTNDKYTDWIVRINALLFNKMEDLKDHVGRVQRLLNGISYIDDDIEFYETMLKVLTYDLEYVKAARDIRSVKELIVLDVLGNMRKMMEEDNYFTDKQLNNEEE